MQDISWNELCTCSPGRFAQWLGRRTVFHPSTFHLPRADLCEVLLAECFFDGLTELQPEYWADDGFLCAWGTTTACKC